jgi:hypothetical protein
VTAVAWFSVGVEDDNDDAPRALRWFRRFARGVRRITWIHFVRLFGIAGLYNEIYVSKLDRPVVVMLLGAMILGTESIRNIYGKGPQ